MKILTGHLSGSNACMPPWNILGTSKPVLFMEHHDGGIAPDF